MKHGIIQNMRYASGPSRARSIVASGRLGRIFHAQVVFGYYVGEVAVELMEATETDSDVSRFIERRGEGFFLISYRVDDVDEALAELEAKGRKTIDQKPRELLGNRYAFIHYPKDLCGVLTEVLDGEFGYDK